MATTHGLTVLAHSCIKPPVNPKTGLSQTLHERAKTNDVFFTDEIEDEYDMEREQKVDNSMPSLVRINPAIESISRELGSLNDDEFYEKLLQLKNEHKKTLTLCEQLYKRKVLGKEDDDHGVNGFSVGSMPETAPAALNGYIDVGSSGELETLVSRTEIPHTSSKPPTGRQNLKTHVKPPNLAVPMPRPSSAPINRRRGSLTRSLDEEVWAKIASERNISRDKFQDIVGDTDTEILARSLVDPQGDTELVTRSVVGPQDFHNAASKVEDMWENFSVEDYAPTRTHKVRPSSATVTRHERETKQKEWRHRITIPKPFKMTLREDCKQKKKTKAQIEAEEKLRQQQYEEDTECQKKFKAQPVPAHIYLPLYDEINERSEARRREVKQYSEQLLRSQERPFSFTTREMDKERHRRTHSVPQYKEAPTPNFKARPVPAHIFDEAIDNKLQEEEEYRKIRIRLRSEELLRKASLPQNMEARQQAKELHLKEKSIKSKRKGQNKPKINHEVPDYDELYRHFQKELLRRKQEREATVVEPFNLNTEKISSRKEKIIRDIERDEETLKENRWPYTNPRSTPRRSLGYLSSSLDALPSNSTKSADLRSTQNNRASRVSLEEREKEELEQERKRRLKQLKLRKEIQERSDIDFSTSLDKVTTRKLRQHREAERERMEQYEKELAEIKERVDKRPLLLQRQSQINAKNAAAKKFSATLKNHGIDEDFIQSHSSRTASVTHETGDDYDEDFDHDNTYSKSLEDAAES